MLWIKFRKLKYKLNNSFPICRTIDARQIGKLFIIINTVLDKGNCDTYIPLVKEIISLFSEYIYTGFPRVIFNLGMECHPINKSKYTENNILRDDDTTIYYENLIKAIELGVALNRIIPSPICIGTLCNDIVTGPNGSIYSCISAIGIDKFKICSYNELMNNPEKFLMQSICLCEGRKGKECVTCIYSPLCNGGCAYNQIVEGELTSCPRKTFDMSIDFILDALSRVEEIGPGIYRKKGF